jgi:ABC-2 type transport system permease protein
MAAELVRSWWSTLQQVGRDQGVLLLLAVAPVIYGFFYPWPYMHQTVTRVPVAIVDLDHSSLSRQIIRFASASARLDVRWVTPDESQAQQALWNGEIEGYAVLPANLKRNVVRASPAVVTVESDGAYALLNKAVLLGFAEAIGTISAGIEIRKLQAGGMTTRQASDNRNPVALQSVPLFNPTEGYGSYVVPAVALLILQQTLLMGSAMLVGTWVEERRHRASAVQWMGRIGALATVGVLSGMFYFGWVFEWQDFPRGGNPWGALALLFVYMPCVATVGALLGIVLGDRERAMQILLMTSLPMAFVAGFSWPFEALPLPLQGLRWLIPSTSAIQASLRLNQMGASIADVGAPLLALCGITLSAATLLIRLSGPVRQRS